MSYKKTYKFISIQLLHHYSGEPDSRLTAARIAKMADSNRQFGQLSPVIVRPSPHRCGLYEIIIGHTRYEGRKEAGFDTIEAFIMDDLSDQEAADLFRSEARSIQAQTAYQEMEAYSKNALVVPKRATERNIELCEKILGSTKPLLLAHQAPTVMPLISRMHAAIIAAFSPSPRATRREAPRPSETIPSVQALGLWAIKHKEYHNLHEMFRAGRDAKHGVRVEDLRRVCLGVAMDRPSRPKPRASAKAA